MTVIVHHPAAPYAVEVSIDGTPAFLICVRRDLWNALLALLGTVEAATAEIAMGAKVAGFLIDVSEYAIEDTSTDNEVRLFARKIGAS